MTMRVCESEPKSILFSFAPKKTKAKLVGRWFFFQNPQSIPRMDVATPIRTQIALECAQSKDDSGKLRYGALQDISNQFNVSKRSVQRIKRSAEQQAAAGDGSGVDLAPKRENVGRPSIWTPDLVDRLFAVDVADRTSLQVWAELVGVSKTTLADFCKRNHIEKKSRGLKPTLSEEHRFNRVDFILSFTNRNGRYDSMHNRLHVDEKWFYVVAGGQLVYCGPGEEMPGSRRAQHKNSILKVMFLTVLGRPYRRSNELRFDGKIGCFPFIVIEPAARSSKNRPAGTLETKAVTVNGEVYAEKMINVVMPAIREKMPWMKGHTIFIQQDGAPPHTKSGIVERIEEACNKDGWEIVLDTQPAQSPDLNLCDLSFFSSLQKRQQKHWTSNIDDLLNVVATEWNDYEWKSLERQWWTLFAVYDEVLRRCGDNDFVTPHSNARALQNERGIPKHARFNRDAVAVAREFLRSNGRL